MKNDTANVFREILEENQQRGYESCMSHILSMHMLQRSEHLVCHALYQPQIIYLIHNDVLAWDRKVHSAFIVIFKNEHASECPIHI